MPVKFRCAKCNRLLGIARRKIGTNIQCPSCQHEQTVPDTDQLEKAEAEVKPVTPAGPAKVPVNPVFEASDFDRLLQKEHAALALMEADAEESDEPYFADGPDPMPQRVLALVQGIGLLGPYYWVTLSLMGLALVLLFTTGLLAGRYLCPNCGEGSLAMRPNDPKKTDVPNDPDNTNRPKVALDGKIRFTKPGEVEPLPDVGSVIIALPANRPPLEKISALGLRPNDQDKGEASGRGQLSKAGGYVAFADMNGNIKLQVPEGKYHLLVISNNYKRANRQVDPENLVQLTPYFQDIFKLLGDYDFYSNYNREIKKGHDPLDYKF